MVSWGAAALVFSSIFIDYHRFSLVFGDFHRFFIDFHQLSLNFIDFHRFSLFHYFFNTFPSLFIDFHWFSLVFFDFSSVFIDFGGGSDPRSYFDSGRSGGGSGSCPGPSPGADSPRTVPILGEKSMKKQTNSMFFAVFGAKIQECSQLFQNDDDVHSPNSNILAAL